MKTVVKDKNLFKITDSLFEAMIKNKDLLEGVNESSDIQQQIRLLKEKLEGYKIWFNTENEYDEFKNKAGMTEKIINDLLDIITSSRDYMLKYNIIYEELYILGNIILNNMDYYNSDEFGNISFSYKDQIKNTLNDIEISDDDIIWAGVEAYKYYSSNKFQTFYNALEEIFSIYNSIIEGSSYKPTKNMELLKDIFNIKNSSVFLKVVLSELEKFNRLKNTFSSMKDESSRPEEGQKIIKNMSAIEHDFEQSVSRIIIKDRFDSYVSLVKNGLSSMGIFYGIHYVFLMNKSDGITSYKIASSDISDIKNRFYDLQSNRDNMSEEDFKNEIEKLKMEKDILKSLNIIEKSQSIDIQSKSKYYKSKLFDGLSMIYDDISNKISSILSKTNQMQYISDKLKTSNSKFSDVPYLYILAYTEETSRNISAFIQTDIEMRKNYRIIPSTVPVLKDLRFTQFNIEDNIVDKREINSAIDEDIKSMSSEYEQVLPYINKKFEIDGVETIGVKDMFDLPVSQHRMKINDLLNDNSIPAEIKKILNRIDDKLGQMESDLFEYNSRIINPIVCLTGITAYTDYLKKLITPKAYRNLGSIIATLTKRNKKIDW